MPVKGIVAVGSSFLLAGCLNSEPEEVVTDQEGPSTGAVMSEEMESSGIGLETQVKQYDVTITGKAQTEEDQPLTIEFELSGTIDNSEDDFELNGNLVIENQTEESQTIQLFEPVLSESEDKYEREIAPSERYQAEWNVLGEEMDGATYVFSTGEEQNTDQISAYNQSHFSERIAHSFQALGEDAGIEEKDEQESAIHYTGEVNDQLDEILSVYWFDPYRVLEKEVDEEGPMTFELVVDKETKLAEKLTITNEPDVFVIEFSNIEE